MLSRNVNTAIMTKDDRRNTNDFNKTGIKVIGLMSGTSLDGVDIACCNFNFNGKWSFELLEGETIPYDKQWKDRLQSAHQLPASGFFILNNDYGTFLGRLVRQFIEKHKLSPDFVSSHGHTIFHQPKEKLTVQIGAGPEIASECGLPVVCDFRTMDVALGGQGAPLVPIGDRLLFTGFDYCLNLGGIANISFDSNGERKAFDICVCNIVLNHYAGKKNLPYDIDGRLAASGRIHSGLLQMLNDLRYYKSPYPKSLGRENIEEDIFPLIDSFNLSVEDILATFTLHVAQQIGSTIKERDGRLLVTGGGAFNKVLLKNIASETFLETVVPEPAIINYKEAIIFGFLGVLRMKGENNCLKSVTGARIDSCGGAVYHYNM